VAGGKLQVKRGKEMRRQRGITSWQDGKMASNRSSDKRN